MYTIYTDKTEDFKCKIGVEGSKISDTKARLVLECDGFDVLFDGKISKDGDCVVPIKKVKNFLSEGDEGSMKLEVIAEDTFFTPWEDEYVVETNKKVTVEVVEQQETIKENKVTVQVQPQKTTKKTPKVIAETDHGKEISKILNKKGITLSNISEHKNEIKEVIKEYTNTCKTEINTDNLLDDIINNLRF